MAETATSLETVLAGLDTDKVDLAELQKLLSDKGLKVVAKGLSEKKESRTSKQSAWATASKTELDADEKKVVESLPAVIGSAPVMVTEADVRDLSEAEVDALMEEELARRETEDIMKGRYQSIRATVLNLVTHQNSDDPEAVGNVVSVKHGHKFVVGKQERGGEADFQKLKDVVAEDVWTEVTDEVTTREVNEEKLVKAMAEGKITLEQFDSIVPQKQVIRTFTVKPLKDGDNV